MAETWLEIAVPASAGYVDELAGILASEVSHAAAGLVVRDDEVAFWVDEVDRDAAVDELRTVLSSLAERGNVVDPQTIAVRGTPPEKEWREAYKRYFRVARLSRQVVVVPSWESYEPTSDDRVIHLDPGQAFGTGSHATTTLVLGELQRIADSGAGRMRSLDAGTGSGILSIAMAKLGLASDVVAFDNDPLAVEACIENCKNNAVTAKVFRAEAPSADDGRFGLIVANIQRHVLLALKEALTESADEEATLVLSGLLSDQLDEVSGAYEQLGWTENRRAIDEADSEWGVVTLSRLRG